MAVEQENPEVVAENKSNLFYVRLTRNGAKDLEFLGELLGEGASGSGGNYRCNWTRGLTIKIYRTKGGTFPVYFHRWSHWQGEGEGHKVVICKTPQEVYEALLNDFDQKTLGDASKEAWEEACTHTHFDGKCFEYLD